MPVAQKPTFDICIICIRRFKHPLPLMESHTHFGQLFFHKRNLLILHKDGSYNIILRILITFTYSKK
jgi:hypothetical protein